MHLYPQLSMINQRKCTTEQFVLYFHEHFRELDEVTPPGGTSTSLSQIDSSADSCRSVPELRIVWKNTCP